MFANRAKELRRNFTQIAFQSAFLPQYAKNLSENEHLLFAHEHCTLNC